MTAAPAIATPLVDRMALHVAGQITWPEPLLRRTCAECQHFNTAGLKTAGKGRCNLVRGHQKTEGKAFTGANAVACPQFRA